MQGSMLYLIWKDPFIAVGTHTFIHHLCEHVGFENSCETERYPEIPKSKIPNMLDYLLLSSEPFPFTDKHIKEIQDLCPNSKVLLIDGEICSWYGSRLKYIHTYFSSFKKELEI